MPTEAISKAVCLPLTKLLWVPREFCHREDLSLQACLSASVYLVLCAWNALYSLFPAWQMPCHPLRQRLAKARDTARFMKFVCSECFWMTTIRKYVWRFTLPTLPPLDQRWFPVALPMGLECYGQWAASNLLTIKWSGSITLHRLSDWNAVWVSLSLKTMCFSSHSLSCDAL